MAICVYFVQETLYKALAGVVGALFLAFYIIWIALVKDRVQFTVELVRVAMRAVSHFWGSYVITVLFLMPMVGWYADVTIDSIA